jgi:S-adenosylmethionine-dependent methyltransferase
VSSELESGLTAPGAPESRAPARIRRPRDVSDNLSGIDGGVIEDRWAPLGERLVDGIYASLRGRVRTYVIDRQLRWHLPPPPADLIDVGGGAGHQALPLARDGYRVTIVDPSPAMLERAATIIAREPEEVRTRVSMVEAAAEDARAAVGGRRFSGVLCHAVIMYVDDPSPLLCSLAHLADDGGIVSVMATNRHSLACRPALAGDWAQALSAFDAERQVNDLGAESRADTVAGLSELFARSDVEPVAWYGVRLFTDWALNISAIDPEEQVLAVELEASRRDPYRQLSRLFHLVGVRRRGLADA